MAILYTSRIDGPSLVITVVINTADMIASQNMLSTLGKRAIPKPCDSFSTIDAFSRSDQTQCVRRAFCYVKMGLSLASRIGDVRVVWAVLKYYNSVL